MFGGLNFREIPQDHGFLVIDHSGLQKVIQITLYFVSRFSDILDKKNTAFDFREVLGSEHRTQDGQISSP